jgi:hypothetical protein
VADQQVGQAVALDDAVDDDDEGAGRAADLHVGAAQCEIRKPAMMAVTRPCSGLTPLAMAKAMASGSATTPTVSPAPMRGSARVALGGQHQCTGAALSGQLEGGAQPRRIGGFAHAVLVAQGRRGGIGAVVGAYGMEGGHQHIAQPQAQVLALAWVVGHVVGHGVGLALQWHGPQAQCAWRAKEAFAQRLQPLQRVFAGALAVVPVVVAGGEQHGRLQALEVGVLALVEGVGAGGHAVLEVAHVQDQRCPDWAFSSAWLAASTMPSLRPNFILRGARLATITVSLPPGARACRRWRCR